MCCHLILEYNWLLSGSSKIPQVKFHFLVIDIDKMELGGIGKISEGAMFVKTARVKIHTIYPCLHNTLTLNPKYACDSNA